MVHDRIPIRNALLSVSDKAGLDVLAQALAKAGVQLFSTGGTLQFLQKCGLRARSVESVTEFPEMMHGRLKTLHPKIFGGILARRDEAEDQQNCVKHAIPHFDLVVVNLYPFHNFLGKARSLQIENIDIGGPSLLRAAAKNHAFVAVLSDPTEYDGFLTEYQAHHQHTTLALREALAQRTFARTANYDAMIAAEWLAKNDSFPTSIALAPAQSLRYGENPHQKAVFAGAPRWKILQGKELSYNNLLDAEAAVRLAHDFSTPACAIVKHGNPCGATALENGSSALLFRRALECDSVSAFGGIVAINQNVDAECAKAMSEIFLEVVIAPSYSSDALAVFSKKANLRLIEWSNPTFAPFEVRAAMGGWLVQDQDTATVAGEFRTVSATQPQPSDWLDLKFAWTVCKHVRSNAIVIAKDRQISGVGAGQMSRVDSVRIAIEKSGTDSLKGAVLASDAFFPFRDNIDLIAPTGVKAIIAPGGSRNDPQVIEACNEHGIVLVFAPERHFRH
jgi:phosphoribosylaminoimidazolecarboxamide formyltransferase / IMP cyclohydrolase